MPVYAYSCQKCGVQFERTQKFSDKPLTRCPECRTGRVRRLLQPPAIVFKGSGWYVTDHRSSSSATSGSSKRSESEPASKESTSKGKGEGGTEASKPAKKETKEAKPAAKSED